MIVGLGTDIVEVERVAAMIERHGDHFLERTFTAAERAYCDRHRHAAERYAGRWAAKEAAMKALGTGFVKGVRWAEIEVLNDPGGAPHLELLGDTRDFAAARGVATFLISISHCRSFATATAIAFGPHGP